jgi:ADP-ribose pyrophosphatase YjhB (NUDIX family)
VCSVAAVVAAAAGTTVAACDFDESARDAYGGITVVVGDAGPPEAFEAALTVSLDRWRRDGVRGVWLEVPAALVKYLPAALERGFRLRGGDATHVLCCAWLPGGESPLPPGPTHQVGVGAVVTDRAGRLLLVQEAVGPAQGRWKLPTGLCEANEDVGAAAAREVREETGLEVRPAEVLAVRHSHGFHRGVSDVFFCVRCEVIDEGAVLTPQAGEIARVAWRPVADAHDAATPAWRRIYQIAATGGMRVDTYPGRTGAAPTRIYSSG